jgi:hypothetical protein
VAEPDSALDRADFILGPCSFLPCGCLGFLDYLPASLRFFCSATPRHLTRAVLVRALDLGSRDAELRRAFPDRPAFRLDLGRNELIPLRAPQVDPIGP